MSDFETNTHESGNQEQEINPTQSKKFKTWQVFLIILIVLITICFIAYREICKFPYNESYLFGDTEVSVKANYNSKYNIIKIDLSADEVIEEWQVDASGGTVEGIKLECETNDKSIKREFKFEDISLEVGKNVETSLSIENAQLKDFVMTKDLLNGQVTIFAPKIISLDSEEREQAKDYYYYRSNASSASFLGEMFLYGLMGGY